MNACIAGCIFSSVLPNLCLGIGALKIHGKYGDYTFCAIDCESVLLLDLDIRKWHPF
jgi:hypothetical protein